MSSAYLKRAYLKHAYKRIVELACEGGCDLIGDWKNAAESGCNALYT